MLKNVIVTICISALSAFVLYFVITSREELMYVDTAKLFSEFKLSKESLKEVEDFKKARKVVLDSLYERVRVSSLKIENRSASENELKEFALLKEEYLYKQQLFDEDSRKMTFETDSKIWNQLNQYVLEYGKEKKYKFILGATGQGNIMYADESKNVTEDMITFVNKKYEGSSK